MDYKLGYHILVLPNQVLLINSVLTNEVLLYYASRSMTCVRNAVYSVLNVVFVYLVLQTEETNPIVWKAEISKKKRY